MLIEFDLKMNFQLSTRNVEVLNKAEELLSTLNVGNRLLELKKSFLVSFIVNLKKLIPNQVLIVQRNKQWYAKRPPEYSANYQTYAIARAVLDELVRGEFLNVRRATRKVTTTGYTPTEKFLDIIRFVNEDEVFTLRPPNLIILRKFNTTIKKNMGVTYRSTPTIAQMKLDIENYSDVRENHIVSVKALPPDLFYEHSKSLQFFSKINFVNLTSTGGTFDIPIRITYLSRIFNESFNNGGRYYRGVESNIPKVLRKYFHINGNPTIELDYKAHHIRMLYNIRGKSLRRDPYAAEENITPEKREIYKIVSLICLNTGNINIACSAIRKELQEQNLSQYLPDTKNRTLINCFNNFINRNIEIKDDMFTSKYAKLTNLDSKISNKILLHFANKNILVLCVHDSYIIEEQHQSELRKIMMKEYKSVFGFNPVIP